MVSAAEATSRLKAARSLSSHLDRVATADTRAATDRFAVHTAGSSRALPVPRVSAIALATPIRRTPAVGAGYSGSHRSLTRAQAAGADSNGSGKNLRNEEARLGARRSYDTSTGGSVGRVFQVEVVR